MKKRIAMARYLAYRLGLLLILLGLAMPCVSNDELYRLWKKQRADFFYQPSEFEMTLAENLFEQIFSRNEISASNRKLWKKLHFEVLVHQAKNTRYLYIIDAQKSGRGFYVICISCQSLLAFQAPHSFYDYFTARISFALLTQTQARAAAWNTVPRNVEEDDDIVNDFADVAHIHRSYFLAFTKAFANVYPTAKIVQLHGFNKKLRRTSNGGNFDIILSNGTTQPRQWPSSFKRCLIQQGIKAGVFPTDVKELGGLQNIHALTLAKIAFDGFLHVEMSYTMRKNMVRHAKKKRLFARCFIAKVL